MARSESREPKFRELFVEELAEVRGGMVGGTDSSSCCTTMACCEEGPDGCCPVVIV